MTIELIPSARVKDMIRDHSSTTKGPGWLTTTVKDMIRDHTLDKEEVAEIMAGMGFHGRATVAGIDLGITSILSALTTLIDVMEREGVEGRSLSLSVNIGNLIAWCLSKLLPPLCFSWGGGRGRMLPTKPRPTLPERTLCGNAYTVDGR